MCPAGVESIVGALYFISSLPSQAIISSHLTQTLWSGYILTCKDGRLVGARDLIMSAVAWGGMLVGNGAEIRAAGSLLGRWDREGGKKPINSCCSLSSSVYNKPSVLTSSQ